MEQEESDRPEALRKRLLWWKQPKKESKNRKVAFGHDASELTQPHCNNKINTAKYSIITFLPRNLFEQFHRLANVYFLFIVLLNWVPAINSFDKEVSMIPIICVLTATALKDLFEDRQRYLSDKKINSLLCQIYDSGQAKFVTRTWEKLRVGDIVEVSNNEQVPADIVILKTSDSANRKCYVETQNMDGETNLKVREAPPGLREYTSKDDLFPSKEFQCLLECTPPESQVDTFHGSVTIPNSDKIAVGIRNMLLRGCVLKNTESVTGLVVYAGHDTKAILNNSGPRYKRSKMEAQINRELMWCWVILLLFCLAGAIGCTLFLSSFTVLPPFLGDLQFSHITPIWTGFMAFWTFILILQVIIPISLYVTIELAKLAQVYLIDQDPQMVDKVKQEGVKCRSFNIAEDLGQVQYMLCDKTGTLTENKLVFKHCTIAGHDFVHKVRLTNESADAKIMVNHELTDILSSINSEKHMTLKKTLQEFFVLLAISNTVNVAKTSNTKAERNIKSSSITYEAESPDELALVNAAAAYGFRLLQRSASHAEVELPDGQISQYIVLHILPFDSERRRMSLIVKQRNSNKIKLLCKGADCSMMPRLKTPTRRDEEDVEVLTKAQLLNFSKKGLRTLVMAERILTQEEYQEWNMQHVMAQNALEDRENLLSNSFENIEANMSLLGATGVEDQLQEDVPSTITLLREAGIVMWMLTGDNQETAINVAHSCNLLNLGSEVFVLNCASSFQAETDLNEYIHKKSLQNSEDKAALVVDGQTLKYILTELSDLFLDLARSSSTVLACRVTPLQKGNLVKLVKESLRVLVLAIGDGANDVSMLQMANIGVGISGQEGRQAVMAADFALPRFHYIRRLLLVHGHWSYYRLASLVLHSFYKNAAFVFVLFWYQLHCGFSGQAAIDQLYLILFSVTFTSLPPLVVGVFERDFSSARLLNSPGLYSCGRLSSNYTSFSFWILMLEALYHSLIIFYIAIGTLVGTNVGIWEFGTLMCSQCIVVVMVQLSMEVRSWTVIHVASILVSICGYLAFGICYSSLKGARILGVTQACLSSPVQWAVILLSGVVAALPRMAFRAVRNPWKERRRSARSSDFQDNLG